MVQGLQTQGSGFKLLCQSCSSLPPENAASGFFGFSLLQGLGFREVVLLIMLQGIHLAIQLKVAAWNKFQFS